MGLTAIMADEGEDEEQVYSAGLAHAANLRDGDEKKSWPRWLVTGQLPALLAMVLAGFFFAPHGGKPLRSSSSLCPHNYSIVLDAGSSTELFVYRYETQQQADRPDVQ